MLCQLHTCSRKTEILHLPQKTATVVTWIITILLHCRNKRFPKKPKSEKISLVSSAAFGGWLIVQDIVLDLFGSSKDAQYLMLVNLLDEISCFNFYFYTVFFRGGNFDSWLQSMLRSSMIFIIFPRRNYDKATLCQLSDILFHVSENPDLGEKIQEFLQVFTEKKIEILHSILRR